MGQIVRRKKKGRPSKADLARRSGDSPPEERDVRRSLRRRNVKYTIDYDDYLDEDSEDDEEEVELRIQKKLKLMVKLNPEPAPAPARGVHVHAPEEESSSSSEEEDVRRRERKPLKKRPINVAAVKDDDDDDEDDDEDYEGNDGGDDDDDCEVCKGSDYEEEEVGERDDRVGESSAQENGLIGADLYITRSHTEGEREERERGTTFFFSL